jgi:hypothetical protein
MLARGMGTSERGDKMTSQLPWETVSFKIFDNQGRQVAKCSSDDVATFIKRACNNHERLVELLHSVLSLECMRDGTEIMLKNAIQQALQSTEE